MAFFTAWSKAVGKNIAFERKTRQLYPLCERDIPEKKIKIVYVIAVDYFY